MKEWVGPIEMGVELNFKEDFEGSFWRNGTAVGPDKERAISLGDGDVVGSMVGLRDHSQSLPDRALSEVIYHSFLLGGCPGVQFPQGQTGAVPLKEPILPPLPGFYQ
ncbi:uncharacterized protein LOC140707469 [Pogona vitticeps]